MAKSIFAGTVVKLVKTGNNWQKVQYINWILPITDINTNGDINDVDIANHFAAHFWTCIY